ncbi:MAG: hypothetical protein FJX72_18815 [Armatimonadetes bacterium]|nr:hypothetical protein [Armatimonadota bacterium]
MVSRNPSRWLRFVAVLAFGAALIPGAAQADDDIRAQDDTARARFNTLYGPVGLITIPTAYVAPNRKVLFGTAFGRDVKTVSANWGLTPGVDVGAAYLDRDSATQKVFGNAKVNIIPQNFKWFEVGVGVLDVADTMDQTFYFVASADWALPDLLAEKAIGFRLHAGVGTGMFKDKPIAGAEVIIDKRFSIAGEWNAKNVNAAFRYVHDNGFALQAGIQDTKGFLGATYTLQF